MKHFFKWFAIAIATQLATAGGMLSMEFFNFLPFLVIYYWFYFIPAVLVLSTTSEFLPFELRYIPRSDTSYIYHGCAFGMVFIFYSLIVAAIAQLVRNFRRRPAAEV